MISGNSMDSREGRRQGPLGEHAVAVQLGPVFKGIEETGGVVRQ